MRNFLCILILLISSFLFTACQSAEEKKEKENITHNIKWEKAVPQEFPNSKNEITLKIDKKQYLTTEKKLTVTIHNNSDIVYFYEGGASIQKKIENIWYTIPWTTPGFEELLLLNAHASTKESILLDKPISPLSPGKYRLIKNLIGIIQKKNLSPLKQYLKSRSKKTINFFICYVAVYV